MTLEASSLLAVRLLLAVVFVLAGTAKLVDRAGSRKALAGFGVPEWLAGLGAIVLPLVEFVVAAALLPKSTAFAGAIGAAVLLGTFLTGIAVNLARGRRPDCHCFGRVHSAPIGRSTLVRNGVLLALALCVTVGGSVDAGPSAVAWLFPLRAFERAIVLGGAAGLGLVGAQNALLVQILRQNRALLDHLRGGARVASAAAPEAEATALPTVGLPVGSPAPAFALADLDGVTVTLAALRAAMTPVLLLFADPGCGSCEALLPEVAEWQRSRAGSLRIVPISRGSAEASRLKFGKYGVTGVLLQRGQEILEAYRVPGTPSAVRVDPGGTVDRPLAIGEVAIRRLVTEEALPAPPAAPAARSAAPTLLSPAPPFRLPDLDGRLVTLEESRGRSTLLLFWNPGCGHCQRMLPDLQRWAARPLTERVSLIVLSKGSLEANRELGLRAPVLVDSEFEVGARYGVTGTPSAVLVDADGRLASRVRKGAAEILSLVGEARPASGETAGLANEPAAPVDDAASAGRPLLANDIRPTKQACVEDELLPGGSMILYNGCRRQGLTLNPTGALVWECCDGKHDLDAIVAELRTVFPGVDPMDEIRGLLQRLLDEGMIATTVHAAEQAAARQG